MQAERRTVQTSDDLILTGTAFRPDSEPEANQTAVVFFDGAGMDVSSSHVAFPMAKALTDIGITFVYADHRGTGIQRVTNRIVRRPTRSILRKVSTGHANERFSESPIDVRAWVDEFAPTHRIILAGRSLGAAKVTHALKQGAVSRIDGLALLTPVDLVNAFQKFDRDGSVRRASRERCDAGKPDDYIAFLGQLMAAGTLEEAFGDGSVADVFAFRRDDVGPILQSVACPVLVIAADRDMFTVNDARGDAERLLATAKHAASTSLEVVHGDHDFVEGSGELAESVARWVSDECLERRKPWYERSPDVASVLGFPGSEFFGSPMS